MAKGRRGRPKQAQARRRATTRAGRVPPRDFGTDEVQRLRQILNPGQPGLPTDPLSALYARGFIDERLYNAGRYFAALVTIARRGWNLRDGSVAFLYRQMVAGMLGEDAAPVPISSNGHDTTAADHARTKLAEMRAALWRPGDDGAVLSVVMRITVDQEWTPWLKRFLARGTAMATG